MGNMKKIFNLLFGSPDDIALLASADARRRKIVNTMLGTMVATIICLLIILFSLYFVLPEKVTREDLVTISTGCLVGLAGSALVAFLNRRISSRAAGVILLLVIYALTISADTPYEIVQGRSLIFVAVPVIMAAILYPPWGGIIVAVINSAAISYVSVSYGYGLPNFPAIWVLFFTALLGGQATSILERALEQVQVFNRSLLDAEEQILQINAGLEERVILRTTELQSANDQLQTEMTERKQTQNELNAAKEELRLANLGLQQALAREQHISRIDSLTGANNRRYFFEFADYEFTVAKRYDKPLSLIMFDIDHFKKFNDTYGHQAGDEILKQITQIARQQLRDADILARYGGEEFVILLPNSDAHESSIVAERIRGSVAAYQMDTNDGRVSATISLGITECLAHTETLDELVLQADRALYAAKSAGRNCVVIYSAE
jgi:diguanylate cyclase (GGDEF)-like protein